MDRLNTNQLEYVYADFKAKLEQSLTQNFYEDHELQCVQYENAIILPWKEAITPTGEYALEGGVVDSDKKFILQSGFNNSCDVYEFNDEEIEEVINEEVIFIGSFVNMWGHFITDCLKHLWYLNSPSYNSLKNKNLKLVYINTKPLSGSYSELIKSLNIDISNCYHIRKITQYKKIHIPDNSFFHVNAVEYPFYFTSHYLDTINLITKPYESYDALETLYFSRNKSKSSRDWGEEYIEKILRKSGVKIVNPEELSFLEQISLLQKCKKLIATEGSIAHNAVFLKEGSEVAILRKYPYVNKYQQCINQVKKLNVVYIDCSLSILNNSKFLYAGPFFIYPNENFCKYLGVDYAKIKFPFKNFSKYIFLIFKSPEFIQNIKSQSFYFEILANEIHKFNLQRKDKLRKIVSYLPFLKTRIKDKIVNKLLKLHLKIFLK